MFQSLDIYGNFLLLTPRTNNLLYFAVNASCESTVPRRGIRNLNMWTPAPVSQSGVATHGADVGAFNHCCSR